MTPEQLKLIRTTLEKVQSIIECTYGHDDETGERDEECSDYSSADIVEFLCEIEGIVDDSIAALDSIAEPPETESAPEMIEVAVCCTNANGEADVFWTRVVAEADFDSDHFSRAKQAAEDAGYDGPFVVTDDTEPLFRALRPPVPETPASGHEWRIVWKHNGDPQTYGTAYVLAPDDVSARLEASALIEREWQIHRSRFSITSCSMIRAVLTNGETDETFSAPEHD